MPQLPSGGLTLLDWGVAAVLLSSLLLSWIRGLVQEVASLGLWLLAAACAWQLAPHVVGSLPDWLPGARLRSMVAIALIMVVLMAAGRLVVQALSALVEVSGLKPLDRMLGLIPGLVRAVLMMVVVAGLAMMTDVPDQRWWREAYSRPWLEAGVAMVRPWLPASVAALIRIRGEV